MTLDYKDTKDEVVKYFQKLEELLGLDIVLKLLEEAFIECFYEFDTVDIILEGEEYGDSDV